MSVVYAGPLPEAISTWYGQRAADTVSEQPAVDGRFVAAVK